jgi:colicin import membrane protein
MARTGITYEQVGGVVETLRGEGRRPTYRLIRERLGGGSPNRIQQHLQTWEQSRPKPGTQALDLAPALLGAVQVEIERHRRAALSALQEELAEQLDRAEDLQRFAEAVESERDAGRAQIEELTSQRDRLDGELQAVRGELAMLRSQIERATGAVEEARIELARTQLQVETFQRRASELETENRQLLERAAVAETLLKARAERSARKS